MTQHPSLKIKGSGAAHRSVLKRFERILRLQKEEKWKEGDPIFGLPKVKTIRVKIKKEKPTAPTPEEGVTTAEGTAESPETPKGPTQSGTKPSEKK